MKLFLCYILGIPAGIVFFVFMLSRNFLEAYIIIYFYRGMVLLLLSYFLFSIFQVLLMGFVLKIKRFYSNALVISTICLAINSTFFCLVPVSLDRAISVFLIGALDAKRDGLSRYEIEREFLDIYIKKYGAIDRRISEQISTGNIIINSDDKIQLTERGKHTASIFKFIAGFLNIDDRFVSPEF